MNASIQRASWTAALLVIAIARPGAADTIHIGFSGVVETVTDATGVLQRFNIALGPGAAVQGAYVVDPQAGVLRFGNGAQGRVPASAGELVSGTYRSGAGSAGNIQVDLFDDCFVGAIVGHECVPGQGADAYLLTLPPNPNVLPLETFLMLLATDEPGPLIQSETFGLIPPPLESFSRAAFVWTFVADGDQATIEGRITSVAIVPQLSSLALFIAGLGGLGMRSLPRSTPGPLRPRGGEGPPRQAARARGSSPGRRQVALQATGTVGRPARGGIADLDLGKFAVERESPAIVPLTDPQLAKAKAPRHIIR